MAARLGAVKAARAFEVIAPERTSKWRERGEVEEVASA